MMSVCPTCGNEINHGKYEGYCKYCKKPYTVEMVQRGKKKYYSLKEREERNDIRR